MFQKLLTHLPIGNSTCLASLCKNPYLLSIILFHALYCPRSFRILAARMCIETWVILVMVEANFGGGVDLCGPFGSRSAFVSIVSSKVSLYYSGDILNSDLRKLSSQSTCASFFTKFVPNIYTIRLTRRTWTMTSSGWRPFACAEL